MGTKKCLIGNKIMDVKRQSNIELCRIIAMLLVVMVHSGMVVFGDIKEYDASYWGILTMQSFSIVGVNLFVLISGYFSVSLKLRSIVRLIWICFFYALTAFAVTCISGQSISIMSALWVSNSIWYIATYIGLLCFSPLLNACVEKMGKAQLKLLIWVLLIFQTWYEYVPRLMNDFQNGYSILSFMILYLIARFVRLYGFPSFFKKYHMWIYVTCSLIIATGLICAVAFHCHPRGAADLLLKYDNPLVIVSSLGVFAFFAQKQMRYNPVVNYIAVSCIAVLLFHTSPIFAKYVASLFRTVYATYAGIILVVIWGGIIAAEFVVAITIDQIRLFIERKWLNTVIAGIHLEVK